MELYLVRHGETEWNKERRLQGQADVALDDFGRQLAVETGEALPPLSFEWCMEVLRQEVVDSVNLLDERRGILHVRRHLAASPLFKGIPNFRNTRIAMLRAETKEELFRIFDEITANLASVDR